LALKNDKAVPSELLPVESDIYCSAKLREAPPGVYYVPGVMMMLSALPPLGVDPIDIVGLIGFTPVTV